MTLPTVAHVHGQWSAKDFRRVLVLRWQENGCTDTQVETLTAGAVAAVLAWDKQPKALTPEERARTLMGWYVGSHHTVAELELKLAEMITDALAADRKKRTTPPVPEEDHGGYVVPTPAQTARAIVADWAAVYIAPFIDNNLFGTGPDSGSASLDDLQRRIAAALGEREAR